MDQCINGSMDQWINGSMDQWINGFNRSMDSIDALDSIDQ